MDFKSSLMTGARDRGFQSTRQQRCNAPTFHELINVIPPIESKPEVTIDRSVENFRLLIGPGIEYVEQVLNYSRTLSLSRRGVSKLVVDPQNYIRLQHHPAGHPESASLLNQLLEEGVEIILLRDVLQHIERKYPATMKSFELFGKVLLKGQPESVENNNAYSRFLAIVISLMLPDYAFMHGLDGRLKTVTVTEISFLSSLFLPASAGRKEDSTVELITGSLVTRGKPLLTANLFLDGSILANLISDVGNPSQRETSGMRGLGGSEENIVSIHLNIILFLYTWMNSADSAKKRADIVNDIFFQLLSKPVFFVLPETLRVDRSAEFSFDEIKLLTLEELVIDVNLEFPALCYLSDFNFFDEKPVFLECAADRKSLISCFLLSFFKKIDIEYLVPELKARADKYNVEWKMLMDHDAYYSADYVKSVLKNNGSGYTFRLDNPRIDFFSQQRENLLDFIQSFALNATDTIKAEYAFPPPGANCYQAAHNFVADLEFPLCCSLFMNVSHMHRLTEGGQAELKNIYKEIISSYSPGAAYCKPGPEAPLLNDGRISSSNERLQAVRSAVPLGFLTGALDGTASHLGLAYLVRNPVSRVVQGYLTGGGLGFGLSAFGWGLSWLPDRLRKGAPPGSFWCGCAVIVDSLGMALPFLLSGNVYRYAGGMLGFMLGKYGAEATLARVLPREEWPKQCRRRRTRSSFL